MEFQAFTAEYSKRTNKLISKVGVSLTHDPQSGGNPPAVREYTAIWDTGAEASVVTKKVVEQIGLEPTGKTRVIGVGGQNIENTYLVNLYLPNKVALTYVRVTECEELHGGYDLLIGMDVISIGDFAVTNTKGKTKMSYRIPSIREIDFVKEANTARAQKQKKQSKVSKSKLKKKRKQERENKKKDRENRSRRKRK
ncbi:retroviral-like aspartic protease family protein [Patescibacteria group bacterium]|nr:retroviral-like aspartic protease family protein [Patescibacteria group bacterium]MBU1868382.1 retroviral-like aspartic protease family protein [Patescibacteria group bacterium]